MSETLQQWKSALANLPETERAELAEFLLDSLDTPDRAARSEWLAVARDRMAEVRAGMVDGIPAQKVLHAMRSRNL